MVIGIYIWSGLFRTLNGSLYMYHHQIKIKIKIKNQQKSNAPWLTSNAKKRNAQCARADADAALAPVFGSFYKLNQHYTTLIRKSTIG